MKIVKAGFLLSYDYEFLKISLPRVYPYLDEIYLCVDKDRKTWTGGSFEIADSFWAWITQIDSDKKIIIYEDNFYIPELSPMECDTRERTMLSKQMGKCDWYLQIDSDEYFVNFPEFLSKLKGFDPGKDLVSVFCRVIPLFKRTKNGYLAITETKETLPFATNVAEYTNARNNSKIKEIVWNDAVVHQSWARHPDEIRAKLSNWGHTDEFNIDSYYNLWNAIDEDNFKFLNDFHPLYRNLWPKLKLIKENDINHVISYITENEEITRIVEEKKQSGWKNWLKKYR